MKNKKISQNVLIFKSNVARYLAEYKAILIVCAIFLFLGIFTGVLTAIKHSGSLELSNLSDVNFVDFLKGDKGTTGLIFPYLLSFVINVCIIIFINFKPWLILVNFLVLLAKGYTFAFDITILIVLYGFSGIINVLFIILPFEILIGLVLIVISSFAIKRNIHIKKYGINNTCKNSKINYAKTYWFLIIIGVVFILLKCLLMPLVRITIIVN